MRGFSSHRSASRTLLSSEARSVRNCLRTVLTEASVPNDSWSGVLLLQHTQRRTHRHGNTEIVQLSIKACRPMATLRTVWWLISGTRKPFQRLSHLRGRPGVEGVGLGYHPPPTAPWIPTIHLQVPRASVLQLWPGSIRHS